MGESRVLERSSDEFIAILKEIPPINLNYPLNPLVITEDFIFIRINSEEYRVIWNYSPVIPYSIPKRLRQGKIFNINSIGNSFQNILDFVFEDIKTVKFRIKSEPFILFISSLLVVILILSVLFTRFYDISYNYRLLFLWFVIFNITGFPFIFNNLRKKHHQKFKIKEKSPILEVINSQRLLILIFIAGFAASDIYMFIYLYFLSGILLNSNYSTYFIFNMIYGTGAIFFVALYVFFRDVYYLSNKKEQILDYYDVLIYNEENFEKKNYYSLVRLEIKNEKILKITPKVILITIINITITIILSI
ncbi:MAG: hypothetical protein EU540_04895 [Promethearchaeota archaeon]|nr:MAG: hypothetical protein EU540_04895 [Candidatus Lokiarchaeota archaeon]